MHTLRTDDRDRSMEAVVSFHGVPMPRGVAFALRDIETDGAPISVFSADRTTGAIAEHNKQFGTHLSAQQHLVDLARQGRGNPANPPSRSSHCYCADATIANLLARAGRATSIGGRIPWWAIGLDIADRGKVEDVSTFMRVARRLGYQFRQPYAAGSERHHVILVESPITVLEARNQISRNRRS